MQTLTPKILLISMLLLFASFSFATAQMILTKADSLFKAHQYTQSFALYQNIYQSGRYSPAMLLKMAYIQEGLGRVSQSLHYLQLYHKATNDELTLGKIEQLVDKNKLEGYAPTDQTFFRNALRNYYFPIGGVMASIVLLLLALMAYHKRKYKTRPLWAGFALLVVVGILFIQINYSHSDNQGIVSGKATYLMSGPSAGASVVAIIDEGHQLKITGHKDIWLRVQWKDKEAFVKEGKLLQAILL